jgi:spore germination protein YaaH
VAANSWRLDAVVTGWIRLDSAGGRPQSLYEDRATVATSTRRFALVTSYSGGRFRPDVVRRLAADDAALADAAGELGRLVASGSYSGVVFDFEDQAPTDTALVLHVLRILGDAAHRRSASTVAIAIPAADTAAYPTRSFADVADALVVMLYDEHWSDIGADRLVAALPLYGYRWGPNLPADALSFDAAQRDAVDAGVEISRDPVSGSLHAALPGQWNLWMSDAQLLRTLRAEVTALGVTHLALWRLGQEDPAVWTVIGR